MLLFGNGYFIIKNIVDLCKKRDFINMIRYADFNDFELLSGYDKHIGNTELKNCITEKRILLMFENGVFVGWLRFNLFWDSIPFMNMLYFTEEQRRKGYGRTLVEFWENEMLKNQYKTVMTSTRADEKAQFFYRKLGYRDCGSLLLPDEPLEIILSKKLV